jgi:hypothetical protein
LQISDEFDDDRELLTLARDRCRAEHQFLIKPGVYASKSLFANSLIRKNTADKMECGSQGF